jgi:hypothetical protein
MATLSTKQRHALEESQFGLPKDRKYPLTDESHVRKAIQYFKACAPGKRNELSKNINKRAKELGMQIKISKDSVFYKFADKNIVKESAVDDYEFRSLLESASLEDTNMGINAMLVFIEREQAKVWQSTSSHELALVKMEEAIYRQISVQPHFKIESIVSPMKDPNYNPMALVNINLKKFYKNYFDYMEYEGFKSFGDRKMNDFITHIYEDIFCYLINLICSDDTDNKKFMAKTRLIRELLEHTYSNNYYVARKVLELRYACAVELAKAPREHDVPGENYYPNHLPDYTRILEEVNDLLTLAVEKQATPMGRHILSTTKVVDILFDANINLVNSVEYLKFMRNEMESEIDIITLTDATKWKNREDYTAIDFLMSEVDKEHREPITSILAMLSNTLRKENITMYNRDYTLELNDLDIIAFEEFALGRSLYVGKDYKGDNVYYAFDHDSLYLLGKTNTPGELLYIRLYEEGKQQLDILNLINQRAAFDKNDTMRSVKIYINEGGEHELLTEGFQFDGEGGFTFSFKPKKSYMDEYAENHTILMQNFKAKNYEGMKTNLAFLFELINSIERRVIHSKKKVKETVRRDAEKARMFAINDFKTYLREVSKAEPGFNFTNYYEESEFGKITVGMKRDDIVGMRRLFQTILMA